jgi:predicted regulator of Ras-like GTPase activity (Roadblock/LC7/MglB family)
VIKLNSELKGRLERIVNDLAKTDGVEGSLIVDGNGEVLANHILQDVDIELFGPMANVITGSSKRLINFSNHGDIERVLVESKNGKALFLHLGNVHFIVLMKNKANVGMVMLSSKRASQDIIDLTNDLTPIQLEEQVAQSKEKPEITSEPVKPEITPKTVEPEITPEPVESEAEITKVSEEGTVPEEKIDVVSEEKDTVEVEDSKSAAETVEITETATSDISETSSELDTASGEVSVSDEVAVVESEESVEEPSVEEESGAIPVIKPPISFPKLMKVTEIPEDEEERLDLLLKIYESIFLAMSIGASKIMGVAPARGLTRKFLPVEECRKLLDGVDVKNNSTIDFVKIRENAEKIPVSEREESFKENFGKIITVITENYGKVMGYSAFRAMIRPEFKIINESYGRLLDELGIKEQLHPELRDFFN